MRRGWKKGGQELPLTEAHSIPITRPPMSFGLVPISIPNHSPRRRSALFAPKHLLAMPWGTFPKSIAESTLRPVPPVVLMPFPVKRDGAESSPPVRGVRQATQRPFLPRHRVKNQAALKEISCLRLQPVIGKKSVLPACPKHEIQETIRPPAVRAEIAAKRVVVELVRLRRHQQPRPPHGANDPWIVLPVQRAVKILGEGAAD